MLLVLMIGSVLFTLVIHQLVIKLGKKRVWQLCTLAGITIVPFFYLIGEGMFAMALIISFINSIPMGGIYINEVLISDSIDYDEFHTGERNEGTFLFLVVFVPKIVSIVAQSLPLSIMSCYFIISSRVQRKSRWNILRPA